MGLAACFTFNFLGKTKVGNQTRLYTVQSMPSPFSPMPLTYLKFSLDNTPAIIGLTVQAKACFIFDSWKYCKLDFINKLL